MNWLKGESFWEWVFFKNLIITIVLYPLVAGYFWLLKDNYNFSLLIVLSLACLFAGWLVHQQKIKYLAPLGVVIFLANILFGFSVNWIDLILTLWFVSAALTTYLLGYIIARHLFGQTEKLFVKKWKEIIVGGLLATLLRIVLAFAFVFFPIYLMAALLTVSYILIVAKCCEFK